MSESNTAKPEKIRAENQPAGTYTLFVYNTGPDDETLSFQVVLTASGASTFARGGSPLQPQLKHPPLGSVELR